MFRGQGAKMSNRLHERKWSAWITVSRAVNSFRIGWTLIEKRWSELDPKWTRLCDLVPTRSNWWHWHFHQPPTDWLKVQRGSLRLPVWGLGGRRIGSFDASPMGSYLLPIDTSGLSLNVLGKTGGVLPYCHGPSACVVVVVDVVFRKKVRQSHISRTV